MRLIFEVLVDRREKVHKCTILPLAHHPDFIIRRFSRGCPMSKMTGGLLLHPDGEDLSKTLGNFDLEGRPSVSLDPEDNTHQSSSPMVLSVVDCNWKRLHGILTHIERPLPRKVSIPEGFVTAYPRRNRQNRDPETGLATIEAIFIAAAFLGHYDESLLSCYYWKDDFLKANAPVFESYGLKKVNLGVRESFLTTAGIACNGSGTPHNQQMI